MEHLQKLTSRQSKQRGMAIVEYVVGGGVLLVVTVVAFIALGEVVATQITRVGVALEEN